MVTGSLLNVSSNDLYSSIMPLWVNIMIQIFEVLRPHIPVVADLAFLEVK